MIAMQGCFSPSFLEKHRSIVKCFRALAQHKANKWMEMQARQGRGVHSPGGTGRNAFDRL